MHRDKEAWAAAQEVVKLTQAGEHITLQAGVRATENMIKMLRYFKTPTGRLEALKHHGLYMGIGREFMASIAPKGRVMADELQALDPELDEGGAEVLTALWLAKIFLEIQKGIEQYDE